VRFRAPVRSTLLRGLPFSVKHAEDAHPARERACVAGREASRCQSTAIPGTSVRRSPATELGPS